MPSETAVEAKAIKITIIANALMAGWGILFAVIARAEAILLDGIFSGISFCIGFLSLWVSSLVSRPGNDRYPFGYAVYEPLLNLCKGVMSFSVIVLALLSAGYALLTGGREVSAGLAVIYALVATAGCFVLAWRIRSLADQSGSSIVATDAKTWMVDGAISAAVAVAFIAAFVLQQLGFHSLSNYVDPLAVVILALMMIKVPLGVVAGEWKQVVAQSADVEVIDEVEQVCQLVMPEHGQLEWRARVLETGRQFYVHIGVLLADVDSMSVAEQDQLREQVHAQLAAKTGHLQLELFFTHDKRWLEF